MNAPERAQRIFDHASETQLVKLTRDIIAIPSPNFGEGKVADYLAEYMRAMGLSVSMMDVPHPTDATKSTKQPVGRLKGMGGGPSLMLNGHMDTNVVMPGWTIDPYQGKFEDGWIWGLGAQDDKGGIAAALTAINAVIRSGIKLKGDIVMCPVATHKLGGTGTRTLLKNGVRADLCINLEHAANTIGSVIVGSIRVKLKTTSPGLFFRFTPPARANYFNAIEQQAELLRRFGPSLGMVAGDWLRFKPHPDLPDFPMIRYDAIHKDHYGRECEMVFQIRTVPGMTLASVKEDVAKVVAAAKARFPGNERRGHNSGERAGRSFFHGSDRDRARSPLVVALARGQELASGKPAEVGGVERIGNFGDGNVLAANGIPTVQYGPGNIKNYPEWPAPDERVEMRELMETTKAVAYAIVELCG